MDGALHTDYTKLSTIQDIKTKISASEQLEKLILTKFGGCDRKLGLPCPFEVLDILGRESIETSYLAKSKSLQRLKTGKILVLLF